MKNSKDDSYRIYKSVRKINREKPKEPILVDGKYGLTSNEKEAVEITIDLFQKTFFQDNQSTTPQVPPKEMTILFMGVEGRKAIKSFKNEKCAGIEKIMAELLMHISKTAGANAKIC